MSNLSPKIWRDKRHAPAHIQGLIELANSVAVGAQRPPKGTKPAKTPKLMRRDSLTSLKNVKRVVDTDRFVMQFGRGKTHLAVMFPFLYARIARTWLRKIARIGIICRKYKRRQWKIPSIGETTVSAKVDRQGELHLSFGPIITALQGIDPSRIRICEVCKNIYWAVRSDARCCSKECSHILRTRRWRWNYLEKHKAQRTERAAEEERSRISRERERLARLKAPTRGTGGRGPRLPKGPNHTKPSERSWNSGSLARSS